MKSKKNTVELKVKEGDTFLCQTLRWDDGWEFDCPSMMISPVIRCYEDGRCHDGIVEDVMMDAILGGAKAHDFEQDWGWRGYKLPVLKRRFREAMRGKKFPIANYHAEQETVKIIKDEDGELTWVTLNAKTC